MKFEIDSVQSSLTTELNKNNNVVRTKKPKLPSKKEKEDDSEAVFIEMITTKKWNIHVDNVKKENQCNVSIDMNKRNQKLYFCVPLVVNWLRNRNTKNLRLLSSN